MPPSTTASSAEVANETEREKHRICARNAVEDKRGGSGWVSHGVYHKAPEAVQETTDGRTQAASDTGMTRAYVCVCVCVCVDD